MKRRTIGCMFAAATAFFLLTGILQTERVNTGIADKIIRFHVIANSDSKEDQELKIKVRNDVDTYMEEKLPDFSRKEDAQRFLEEQTGNLEKLALARIKEEGYAYPVRVELGKYDFPEKVFGNYVFPEGRYEALRLVIGEGGGHNWWGVMYPNLCFVDGSYRVLSGEADRRLKNILSEEEYGSILSATPDQIKVSFRLPKLLAGLFDSEE